MTRTACLVCGGAYASSGIPGLVRCRQCGFVSADLELEPAALAGLDSPKYFAGEA